jgi:DNA-binding MarR family transcriptional regulator
MNVPELLDEVLISLRRILRATSIHSRKLGRSVGLTGPQLLLLHTLEDRGTATASELARAISLSQATITLLVADLEQRGLLLRERSEVDRRRIDISVTDAGKQVMREAPQPLQESFARRFAALPDWEQHQLVAALERVAAMMDADELDAAPLLTHDPDIGHGSSPRGQPRA